MTIELPGVPQSPHIERLRRAVEDYHNEHGVMGPASDLIGAAASVVDEYDTQVAYVKVLTERQAMTNFVEQARARAAFPAPESGCSCPGSRFPGDPMAVNIACPVHRGAGVVKGTLDQ